MTTLIIPAAGLSTRFDGLRPKWLLTMPDGKLMIQAAIDGIISNNIFSKIVFIFQKRHVEEFSSLEKLYTILSGDLNADVEIILLDAATKSQSETVYQGILKANIAGPILIKDCDNFFEFSWNGGNQVACINAEVNDTTPLNNKSFIAVDPLGNITNIVEKKIISNLFCCGAYGFQDAKDFANAFVKINKSTEIYISHVIFQMILMGSLFKSEFAHEYHDWGTKNAYKEYMSNSMTVFCDFDGVLVTNGAKFQPTGWNTTPIIENLEYLRKICSLKNIKIIITTSRPHSEKDNIYKILLEYDIIPFCIITDLPHSKRVLINDFSATNPYPSAIAINLERNSNNLEKFLGNI